MKVVFSDKYKIVKEKKFHAKESDILLILPLLIQILLSYLGNRFNSIFYFFRSDTYSLSFLYTTSKNKAKHLRYFDHNLCSAAFGTICN